MRNCMVSCSLALGGLVARKVVYFFCERRGFSLRALLITCTLYRYQLQFYTCYRSDTDTDTKKQGRYYRKSIADPIIGATLIGTQRIFKTVVSLCFEMANMSVQVKYISYLPHNLTNLSI